MTLGAAASEAPAPVVPGAAVEVCDNGSDADCQSLAACLPDLLPVSVDGDPLPAQVQEGGTILMGYSYANAGGGPTTGISAANPPTNGIHLSTSTDIADSIGLVTTATRTSNVAAGGDSSLSPVNVPIPVAPGVYQVLFEVDVLDVVVEASETDNWMWAGQLTVTP